MNIPPSSQIIRQLLNKDAHKSLILEALDEIHVLNPEWFKRKTTVSSFRMLFKAGHFDAAKKMHDLGLRTEVEKYRSVFASVFCMLREEHRDREDDPEIIRAHFNKAPFSVTGSFQTPNSVELMSLPLVHDLKALANFFFDADAAPYSLEDQQNLWKEQVIVKLDVKKFNKSIRKELTDCLLEQRGFHECDVLSEPFRRVLADLVSDFAPEEKIELLNKVIKNYRSEVSQQMFMDQEQAVILVDVLCDNNYKSPTFKEIFEKNRSIPVSDWYFQNDNFVLLSEPNRGQLVHCFNHPEILNYSTRFAEGEKSGSHPERFQSEIRNCIEKSITSSSVTLDVWSKRGECLLKDFKVLVDMVVHHPELKVEDKKNWLADLKMIDLGQVYNDNDIQGLPFEQAAVVQKLASEWNRVVLPHALKKTEPRSEPDKNKKRPAFNQGGRF